MKSEYTKFVVLTCLISLLTALVLGGFAHQRIKNIVLKSAISELSSASELVSLELKGRYDKISSDINILSTIPDVINLGKDAGNDENLMQDHLTNQGSVGGIFMSIMRQRTYYTQMRIIGHAGQELVRVNKTNDGFERVPNGDLQSKLKEPYYIKGVKLESNEMYYSAVTYNREYGVVTPDRLPTQRFVKGIYDKDGRIIAMLVINIDYPVFIEQVLMEYLFDRDIIISNHLEDTMVYERETQNTHFYFHDDKEHKSLLADIHELNASNPLLTHNGEVFLARMMNVDPHNPKAFLKVVVRMPEQDLLDPVYRESLALFLYFVLFTAIAMLVVIIATRWFMRPIIEQEKALRLEAETSNTELEEFAYRTSHDLRSPLVSSIALLDMAVEAIDAGEYEEAKMSASLIKNSLVKLEVLVKDILELTKAKNSQEDIQVIHFEEIVDETLKDLSNMEHFERLNIIKDLNYDGKILSQKSRVSLIVSNLISNAIKYQDAGKLDSFIKISTYQHNGAVVFKVEDNGLGVPKNQQDKLFSMFKRFHPKVSFGSGLGLYMMKKSAEIIYGKVEFIDTGHGSVFTLTVPLSIQ